MADENRLGPRAEGTRGAILRAAEQLFAERGYGAARLEDVAALAGIRRASIDSYFEDKQTLHDAVMADVLGELLERVREALLSPASLSQRIEAAVSAWVDFVGGRPTLARLLLREVADAAPGRPPRMLAHTQAFVELVEGVIESSRDDPLAERALINPAHLASAIAGSTLFFVAAMPTLMPNLGFDPLKPAQLEMHRSEVLRMTRRLLGSEDLPLRADRR